MLDVLQTSLEAPLSEPGSAEGKCLLLDPSLTFCVLLGPDPPGSLRCPHALLSPHFGNLLFETALSLRYGILKQYFFFGDFPCE